MNENHSDQGIATEAFMPEDGSLSASDAPADREGEFPLREGGGSSAADRDPALFADPGRNPDPDPLSPSAGDTEVELARVRAELKELQEELARKQRQKEEEALFRSLYPDTPLDTLPDAVWRDVAAGLPLAAAYALSERRRQLTEQALAFGEKENRRRSSGPLGATEVQDYSPEEVRRMTRGEVRANLSGIRRSMQKWGRKRI